VFVEFGEKGEGTNDVAVWISKVMLGNKSAAGRKINLVSTKQI
jgi:hypothetical protein